MRKKNYSGFLKQMDGLDFWCPADCTRATNVSVRTYLPEVLELVKWARREQFDVSFWLFLQWTFDFAKNEGTTLVVAFCLYFTRGTCEPAESAGWDPDVSCIHCEKARICVC